MFEKCYLAEIGSHSRAGRRSEASEESYTSKYSCEYIQISSLFSGSGGDHLILTVLMFDSQRYLGTAREDESLNILLEFVPGGSISSLLGKFGSFSESVSALVDVFVNNRSAVDSKCAYGFLKFLAVQVIRKYTKQLLLGLAYLHKNGIMHRDIKVTLPSLS